MQWKNAKIVENVVLTPVCGKQRALLEGCKGGDEVMLCFVKNADRGSETKSAPIVIGKISMMINDMVWSPVILLTRQEAMEVIGALMEVRRCFYDDVPDRQKETMDEQRRMFE